MAKTVKATLGPVEAPSYKPRLFLCLEGQDVSQVKDLKVGDKIEALVTGKVVGLSQRERPGDNGKGTVKSGDIDLEGYRVKILGEDDNVYEKMAKDEEAE